MTIPNLSTRHLVLTLAGLFAGGSSLYAQSWSDLVHPENPHFFLGRYSDAPMSIPDLITDPTADIKLPIVVVLLEFPDVVHNGQHTVAFYQDLLFGDGGGPWTSQDPSLKQIIWETSNGRFTIVPALETHGTLNDGIIGWVETRCPPGLDGHFCVLGPHQDESCDPADPACTEGTCAACDSWEYHEQHPEMMRSEAIRLADPDINFALYDTRDESWNPGAEIEALGHRRTIRIVPGSQVGDRRTMFTRCLGKRACRHRGVSMIRALQHPNRGMNHRVARMSIQSMKHQSAA